MELKLPNNYVEIEENEMMYLDGGWSSRTLGKNLMGVYNWASYKVSKGLGMALRQIGFWSIARNLAYGLAPITMGAITIVIGKAVANISKYGWQIAMAGLIALGLGTWALGTYRVFY